MGGHIIAMISLIFAINWSLSVSDIMWLWFGKVVRCRKRILETRRPIEQVDIITNATSHGIYGK